jgi:hypothetical protein
LFIANELASPICLPDAGLLRTSEALKRETGS